MRSDSQKPNCAAGTGESVLPGPAHAFSVSMNLTRSNTRLHLMQR